MCGIAGKVTTGEPVDATLLERMCQVIEHRGPDSRGAFLEGGVGLGIQRLAIIDLSTGDQPIYNEDGSVVVVLNGEIYNYRELRRSLEQRGHRFGTHTDTETIVHLYEEYGEACVEHLRGMFAFALWDRSRRELLLARDRVGKKPLFYSHRDGALWFGSEPKSILQDGAVPRDVDLGAVDCFLRLGYVPDPLSAFRALRKLPPAHTLTWRDGSIRTRRYWRLSYRSSEAPVSEAEMQESIREELLEATRLRLRSDVPLGAFLSGGVDSSAVVAAMVRESSARVKTFSIGFDVGAYDETAQAREVSRLLDTDHHELRVEARALDVLPTLVWQYGEPFADPSAIPSLYLAEMTRRHVKVALNGDGGDENFAGYERYHAYQVAHRLGWVPDSAARLGVRGLDRTGIAQRLAPARRLRWLLNALSTEPYERIVTNSLFLEPERSELYTPELRESLDREPERPAASVLRDAYLSSDAETSVERYLDVDVQTYLAGALLVKVDIATMTHSLEVRSPLLDHRFMETAAALPASSKLDGSRTKRVFKDALRPWLPDHILDRPKMGFGVPLAAWFRGPLRHLPGGVLLDPRSTDRGMFREEGVRGLVERHVNGTEDNAERLWALIQLELWMRSYVDPEVPTPLTLDAVAGG
ncbi:MAG: asparagine synthase (glutamine-hydrolyzing) [Thermoleophilaceae bacterium]